MRGGAERKATEGSFKKKAMYGERGETDRESFKIQMESCLLFFSSS